MAPTNTTTSTFEPLAALDGKSVSKTTMTEPAPKHIPTLVPVMPEPPKRYQDVLAYEDKWIGWDGPVWCKRYGRFEDADDAAKDDGYESAGQVHHQDLGPQHKHCEGCTCRAPVEHQSYVQDIKRRVEPMVASLVNLEHQVAKLVHHVEVGGHTLVHHEIVSKPGNGDERFAMHDDGLSHHKNRREPHQSETLVKLEGQIHALQHQVHELMKNNHSFTRST